MIEHEGFRDSKEVDLVPYHRGLGDKFTHSQTMCGGPCALNRPHIKKPYPSLRKYLHNSFTFARIEMDFSIFITNFASYSIDMEEVSLKHLVDGINQRRYDRRNDSRVLSLKFWLLTDRSYIGL